jgi:hypothetical protein
VSGVALFVGTNKGLFVYTSDATRQRWEPAGPHISGWEVSALHLEGAGRRVLAATCHMAYGPTLRASDDLGATWRQLPGSPRYARESGRRLRRIWCIVPGHCSGHLYAGVDEAGVFVSRDRGQSWQLHEGFDRLDRTGWEPTAAGLALHSIITDPVDAARLWVAVSGAGIFRSADCGESWEPCASGLPGAPGAGPPHLRRGVIKLVRVGETLFVRHRAGVFRSADGGDSWAPAMEGLPTPFGFPLCAASSGELFTTAMDPETRCFPEGRATLQRLRGGRWEPVCEGLPRTPHFVGVLRDAVATDGLNPLGVYVGTTQGDLFASTDGGEEWCRLPGRFSRVTILNSCLIE